MLYNLDQGNPVVFFFQIIILRSEKRVENSGLKASFFKEMRKNRDRTAAEVENMGTWY